MAQTLKPLKKLKQPKVMYGNANTKIIGKEKPVYTKLANAQRYEDTTRKTAARYGKTYEETTDDRNVVEKALNLGQGQGFFGDVFEVLGRPMRTIQGALIERDPLKGA